MSVGTALGAESHAVSGAAWPQRAARWLAPLVEQRDRWALWIPVLFGAGIGVYFALPVEPAIWAGPAAMAFALAAVTAAGRRPALRLALLGVAFAAAGFALAQWRAHSVAAPVLERELGAAWVSGRVIAAERLPEGRARVTLDRVLVQGVPAERTPVRVRIRLLPGDTAEIGAAVRLRAKLSPPAPPAAPGAYDFQRTAWFARIGAVGFAFGRTGPAERLGDDRDGASAVWLAELRMTIADRIRAALPGTAGEMASAFLIGDRSAIPREVVDAMRDSGLAHLLAISGLNVGLAAGILFFGVRLLLTLAEAAALRLPVKKIAAACAFLGALAYLLVSGAAVPMQRAFIMTGLVLVAVMVDRTALTLRLLAWAAMLVLVLAPESLTGPSFQMSFAAVLALIALYETLRLPMRRWRSGGGLGRRAGLYLAGLAISTMAAGGASGIIALHHFGRATQYGLIANMIAVPVTAFWIMPWGVAAFLLMPFGLEHLALQPMAYGIEAILATAETVSSWPGATVQLPPMPVWGLVLCALGGLWLCIWRGRVRWGGVAGVLAGLATLGLAEPPDILINGNGRLIAVRMADGQYGVSNTRAERFAARVWMEETGGTDMRPWPDTVSADGTLSCDLIGCIYRPGLREVALVQDARALAEDCAPGAIVVSAVPVRRACRSAGLVIDRFDLWRDGAHALWLRRGGVTVVSVRAARGDRLWTHGPPARAQRKAAGASVSIAASGRPDGPAP
jgi:competence protein ComEC